MGMRIFQASLLSWIVLALALLVWTSVGYFITVISAEETAHLVRAADTQAAAERQAADIRLHALARETKSARDALSEIARTGIIEILESVEAVGKDVGTKTEISQVLTAPATEAASTLGSAEFVIKMEGTFSKLMHVIALLESLPIPSSVRELQLESASGANVSEKNSSSPWSAVVRVRFLTTAETSL